jgi:hypothetical protein
MLIEGSKVIWSSDMVTTNDREFHIPKDSIMNLMAVHIGFGQYEYQAVCK